jgi:hypothetical protein
MQVKTGPSSGLGIFAREKVPIVPSKIWRKLSDSEKNTAFSMKFPGFHRFSSAHQFPRFSEDHPSPSETQVLASKSFAD